MNDPGSDGVIVNLKLSADAQLDLDLARAGKPIDLNYLSGTIEILSSGALIVVGVFDSAVLLLPTLDSLACAIRGLRTVGSMVTVSLVGDTGDMYFLRRQGTLSPMTIAHRGQRTPPIETQRFDIAVMEAASDFLRTIRDAVPASLWNTGTQDAYFEIATTWPALKNIWNRRRF